MADVPLEEVFEVLRAYCRLHWAGDLPVQLRLRLRSGQIVNHSIPLSGRALESAAQPVAARPEPVAAPAGEVRHSADYRTVHWRGEDYTFTAKQAAVVQALWEAWDEELPEVPMVTLLQRSGSSSERLRDVFRDHPAWGSMIVRGTQRDTCRLSEGT
jgi:hypothetical protein